MALSLTLTDIEVLALRRALIRQRQVLDDEIAARGVAVQPREQRNARVDRDLLGSVLNQIS